ncbi:MAG: NAD-dependent succinate-semialdehyde dehydrogenase [Planctomycetota bacterium]|jgi:succinate-semialdehyde dehydrogenase/glutarate-semialdehyde dehydrogenase
MKAINPATEELIEEYSELGVTEIAYPLNRADEAFHSWRETTFAERAVLMHRAAEILREGKEEYGALMTREMGKTVVSAEAEAEKCAWGCDYYADTAEQHLAPEVEETDASRSFVRYDPLGAVLAVMPWNFPFWQVFRFAAPSLMAGNVGVLKHASNVPGCALAIEDVFRKAGFPDGVFTTLLIPSGPVADVIRHPAIKAVTLTGSEPAGVAVAAEAGKALKKTVLELGGSDPFIVLADADIEETATAAVIGRTINNGQSCIAAKRFIVEEPIFEEFEAAFTQRMAELRVGDPMDRATDVGPLARPDLVDDLDRQVQHSIGAGGILLLGGKRPEGKGYFFEPTVLTQVKPGMAAFDEETFGPVAALVRAEDVEDAVSLANHTSFGLGASVWTGDPEHGEALAARIEAGAVFVNGIVKSDPRLPFGGVKRSGYGRELARHGIREFVNAKTVWVR